MEGVIVTKRRKSKQAKDLYTQIKAVIASDPEVIKKTEEAAVLSKDLHDYTSKLEDITKECEDLKKKTFNSIEQVFESLPIESLRDLHERSNGLKTSKASFKDMLKYNELRKNGNKIIENKSNVISKAKVYQIETVQAQIEALLRQIES